MAIDTSIISQVISQGSKDIAKLIAAARGNYDTFHDMKGMYWGRDVVICGAGPTLNNYRNMEGAIHVALNRALVHKGINYDWFVADDWKGIEFFQKELEEADCAKLFGRFSDELSSLTIPQSFGFKSGAKWFYTDLFLTNNGFDGRFVVDIDKMAIGAMPNIALEAIQIFLFTLPKRIYLVGCDSTIGHFALEEKDSEEMKKYQMEVMVNERVIDKWKILKRFADIYYPDTEIISINPVRLAGIFTDIYQ